MSSLRVWWIPQVPCPTFHVDVSSVREGVSVMNILARYDSFQFDNDIKPDYSNAGGIEQLSKNEEWEDWDIDDVVHGYFDDPYEYVEAMDKGIDDE